MHILLTRPIDDCWEIWVQSQSDYRRRKREDNVVGTAARDWLTWLLFGERFASLEAFQSTEAFSIYKERIRKAINRCSYNAHQALLIHGLRYHNLNKSLAFYRKFISQTLLNTNLFPRVHKEELFKLQDAIFSWGLKKENLHELALLLFSNQKTLGLGYS